MPARKRPRPAPRALWMDAIEETWRRTGFKAGTCSGTGGITARAYADGAMTPVHETHRVPGVNQ